MTYIPNTLEEQQTMLEKIGVKNFSDLVSNIPSQYFLQKKLNLKEPLSEFEVFSELNSLAQKNESTSTKISFVGGGAYDHFIPSAIDAIASRSEFYTAYTPYQAEVSQGTLQVMYEFQSMVAELLGMDVANASMYDGGTALAEAILLCASKKEKKKIVIAGKLNPNYLAVCKTYAKHQDIQIIETKLTDGVADISSLEIELKSKDVAAVVVQHPNFYGRLEDVDAIHLLTKSADALLIAVPNPISLGLLKSPGEYGADIAVCEGQPLGCPLNLGGPYVGLFAVKKELIRSIPGRLSGVTVDKDGKKGFVLTLQTREQHIRRDKATSNICTSQTLLALRATVYMSLLGKNGLKEVANLCLQKSHYLYNELKAIYGITMLHKGSFFFEFAIKTSLPTEQFMHALLEKGFFGGVDLSIANENGLLISVTEKRTKKEMDNFVEVVKEILA